MKVWRIITSILSDTASFFLCLLIVTSPITDCIEGVINSTLSALLYDFYYKCKDKIPPRSLSFGAPD